MAEHNKNGGHGYCQPPNSSTHSSTQLYMGDLDTRWNEDAIRQIWAQLGESNVNIKMMWNHDRYNTGMRKNMGYCFVEFATHANAENALMKSGVPIPGYPHKQLKLNWSSSNAPMGSTSNIGNRLSAATPHEVSVFVGDLAPNTTEAELFEVFIQRFPSTINVRIVHDPITSVSKGYGFVKFTNAADQQRALSEMKGIFLNGRALKVAPSSHDQHQGRSRPMPSRISRTTTNIVAKRTQTKNSNQIISQFITSVLKSPVKNRFTDPNNTTLAIKGLSKLVSLNDLKYHFNAFGDILSLQISKSGGYVQFALRRAAQQALQNLQNTYIRGKKISLSWGTLPTTIQTSTYNPAPVFEEPIYGLAQHTKYYKDDNTNLIPGFERLPITDRLIELHKKTILLHQKTAETPFERLEKAAYSDINIL